VLPVLNVVNVLFDVSVSKRPSALDNPCAVKKPTKKVLETVVGLNVEKEKKKKIIIIEETDSESEEIVMKKTKKNTKTKTKKLKANIVFEIIED
jgi:hypothetical protein